MIKTIWIKYFIEFIILIIVSSHLTSCQYNKYINPQGTYVLNEKINRDSLPIYEYFGDIQVLALSKNKVIVTFFICSGAPHYYIGTFIDTLYYKSNKLEYLSSIDSTCRIILTFDQKGVNVIEKTKDFYQGCGFGTNIDANKYFKRTSNQKPELINPITGQKIKQNNP